MASAETVATYFDATPAQILTAARRRLWLNILFSAVFVAVAIYILVLAVQYLLQAWLTADWTTLTRYWATYLQAFLYLLLALRYLTSFESPYPALTGDLASLRLAAETRADPGIEESVIEAEPDVAPDVESELPLAGSQSFSRLRRSTTGGGWMSAFGAFWLVVAIGSGVIAVIDALGGGPASDSSDFSQANDFYANTFLAFLLTFVSFAVAYALFLHGSRASRRLQIVADEWGVRWRDPWNRRAERTLAWHEIRAFVVFTHRDSVTDPMRRLYALLGDEAILAWDTAPKKSRESAEHERLRRAIEARAHLALRDLSETVDALVRAQRSRVREQAPLAPEALAGGRAAPRRQSQLRERLQNDPAIGIALVTMLVVLVFTGAAFGLEKYQESYLSTLPAQLHQETPILRDAFTAADVHWPVGVSDGYTPTSSLLQGVYIMSAPSAADASEGYALAGQTYGSAAVEVTATMISSTASSDFDASVGVVVRAGGGSPTDPAYGVVFEVFASGDWDITEFDPFEFDPNRISASSFFGAGFENAEAVHTGIGATNRLLLLMRGGAFICYINDQYVGSAYDSPGLTLSKGAIGVYTNSAGEFSHFAVYPVQAASSLTYV